MTTDFLETTTRGDKYCSACGDVNDTVKYYPIAGTFLCADCALGAPNRYDPDLDPFSVASLNFETDEGWDVGGEG